MIKNKRGDIPITILVIGVLAICLLAILSFYISDRTSKSTFNSVDLPEKVAMEKEKISVYTSLGVSIEEAESLVGVKTDSIGKYIEMKQGSVSVKYYIP